MPFEFPILSNGGNEISIYRNKQTNKLTVTFWVIRSIMIAPSTSFIYTNDTKEIEQLDNEIKNHPKNNWKIEDNWYRILE